MKQLNKMKTFKIFLFVFILFAAGTTNAQVGIGIANPNASAQLDVSSTSKGLLPPRMTQAQRDAITNPVAGLMIWCKNCGPSGEIQVFNGITWTNMVGGGGAARFSVVIGTQEWMIRNLDVTTYRNGDPIPQVTNQTQWDTTHTGAWCYYNNDPANGPIYGKLYNWYAVKDPRGLAPAGWHIPSDGEVTILRNYLGGINVAGGTMKDTGTVYWNSPNIGANNTSGFTALPGGLRYYQFYGIGTTGQWWTSTPDSGPFPYRGGNYSVGNSTTIMGIGESDPNAALSIRCVRD